MVVLFLIFGGNFIFFSMVYVSIYILNNIMFCILVYFYILNNVQGFSSLHMLANICYLLTILTGVRGYLIVLLTCISIFFIIHF